MIYQWKLPGLIPADAQTAGEELDRIYRKHGQLDPKDIVDESRDTDAPLHGCFEWDDAVAAERYRMRQAGDIVRAIVTVPEGTGEQERQAVRAVVHVQGVYLPFSVVFSDEEKMQELLTTALKDLAAFKKKYHDLAALAPVFSAIDEVSAGQRLSRRAAS